MNQPSSTGDSALTTTRHKERACARRHYERITAERTALGMCPRCGKAKPVPDRTLCRPCGEKRRRAERARHAKAKSAGMLYAGRDAERCRRSASDRSKRRNRARKKSGLCTRCGKLDPSRKSGGALHRLHCFCLEFDGACEVQRRVPTDWIIEPIDVPGYGSFSLAS